MWSVGCVSRVVCILALCATFTECARILCVLPMPAPSHYFLGNKLMRELAARGHEITMVSAFEQKPPMKNYRDITLTELPLKMKSQMPTENNLFEMKDMHPIQSVLFTKAIGSWATLETMKDPKFQKLLKSNEKFDLVVFEMFYTEALFGLGHFYKCPIVVLSTIGSSVWTNHLTGNPSPWSYTPDVFLKYPNEMSFCQRLTNVVFGLVTEIYRKYIQFPEHNKILKEFFPDAPDLEEIMYNNMSLILMNSHSSISGAKPHVPAMVEIGGFHVDNPKPLPKDLKDFMDNAKHGVVLFSMGSILKGANLPPKKRDAILKSFAKLKQNVLWKFEDENLENKPDNVKIMKWLPQNDIMAHPNLKLFVTHGGLLSTTEAIYHGIPLIGLPVFGDQQMNVDGAVNRGYAVRLDFIDLTEETFTAALNKILSDPKYMETAKSRSRILHDQPVRPIDAAVFWTEYVIRHKGARHLRSAALSLHWTQIYLLDVAAVSALGVIFILSVFYLLIKKCCRKKTVNKEVKKKKQ